MTTVDSPARSVSRQQPFPGLVAFGEEANEFFYGRAEETEELFRLVRRDPLTVVFGRSGLGKTSLLQAGLFPKLRADGFLPIPVRLFYGERSAQLIEQIKSEIARNIAERGVEAEAPKADETLWEFFHRVRFWDERNRLLTPVLVLDQFEELFTLGGRGEYVDRLVSELENLIENRVPASVRRRMEADDEDLPFTYAKQHYRVLLSLREDYLPQLEELASGIPSIKRQRMRLTRMNGDQALEAILKPAGHLVEEASARKIVRFVSAAAQQEALDDSGPQDFEDLEVEPALLALICFELNRIRISNGLDKIDAELLEGGAQTEILGSFYERCTKEFGPEISEFVEDRLLTASGFRGTIAVEDALRCPGVTSDVLDALVDRRLLRVEMRLGIPHVEITHDVLTGVIQEQRERRRHQTQRARERTRRRKVLVRFGVVGACLLLLAVGATAVAIWALGERDRARRAEEDARTAQKQAEDQRRLAQSAQANSEAQKLLAEKATTRAEAALAMQHAATARAHLAQAVTLVDAGDEPAALAKLAEALRLDPANDLVVDKIAELLTHRSWLVQAGPVLCAASTPDGTEIVVVSRSGIVRRFHGETGVPVGPDRRLPGPIALATISKNAGLIAAADTSGNVHVMNGLTGELRCSGLKHTARVNSIQFAPNLKSIVVGVGGWRDHSGYAQMWDIEKGARHGSRMWHEARVVYAEFAPDGIHVATASWDWSARLWHAKSGKPASAPLRHGGWVSCVRFAQPDGAYFASTSWDGTARIWRTNSTKSPVQVLRHDRAGTDQGGDLDVKEAVPTAEELEVRVSWADFRRVRPRGSSSKLLLATASGVRGYDLGYVRCWEMTTKKPAKGSSSKTTAEPLGSPLRHEAPVERVGIGPSGTAIATLAGNEAWFWQSPTASASSASRNGSGSALWLPRRVPQLGLVTDATFGFRRATRGTASYAGKHSGVWLSSENGTVRFLPEDTTHNGFGPSPDAKQRAPLSKADPAKRQTIANRLANLAEYTAGRRSTSDPQPATPWSGQTGDIVQLQPSEMTTRMVVNWEPSDRASYALTATLNKYRDGWSDVAIALKRRRDHAGALAAHESALAIARHLHMVDDSWDRAINRLVYHALQTACARGDVEPPRDATRLARWAASLSRAWLAHYPDHPKARRPLSVMAREMLSAADQLRKRDAPSANEVAAASLAIRRQYLLSAKARGTNLASTADHFALDCRKQLQQGVRGDARDSLRTALELLEARAAEQAQNGKTTDAATSYAKLSAHYLFLPDPKRSLAAGRRAMELDQAKAWVMINCGHARLLQGDRSGAERIYRRIASRKTPRGVSGAGKPFAHSVIRDLQDIADAGVPVPGHAAIVTLMKKRLEK